MLYVACLAALNFIKLLILFVKLLVHGLDSLEEHTNKQFDQQHEKLDVVIELRCNSNKQHMATKGSLTKCDASILCVPHLATALASPGAAYRSCLAVLESHQASLPVCQIA